MTGRHGQITKSGKMSVIVETFQSYETKYLDQSVVSVACHDSKFLLLQYALSINSILLLGRIVCDTMLTLSATEDVWSRDCVIK